MVKLWQKIKMATIEIRILASFKVPKTKEKSNITDHLKLISKDYENRSIN